MRHFARPPEEELWQPPDAETVGYDGEAWASPYGEERPWESPRDKALQHQLLMARHKDYLIPILLKMLRDQPSPTPTPGGALDMDNSQTAADRWLTSPVTVGHDATSYDFTNAPTGPHGITNVAGSHGGGLQNFPGLASNDPNAFFQAAAQIMGKPGMQGRQGTNWDPTPWVQDVPQWAQDIIRNGGTAQDIAANPGWGQNAGMTGDMFRQNWQNFMSDQQNKQYVGTPLAQQQADFQAKQAAAAANPGSSTDYTLGGTNKGPSGGPAPVPGNNKNLPNAPSSYGASGKELRDPNGNIIGYTPTPNPEQPVAATPPKPPGVPKPLVPPAAPQAPQPPVDLYPGGGGGLAPGSPIVPGPTTGRPVAPRRTPVTRDPMADPMAVSRPPTTVAPVRPVTPITPATPPPPANNPENPWPDQTPRMPTQFTGGDFDVVGYDGAPDPNAGPQETAGFFGSPQTNPNMPGFNDMSWNLFNRANNGMANPYGYDPNYQGQGPNALNQWGGRGQFDPYTGQYSGGPDDWGGGGMPGGPSGGGGDPQSAWNVGGPVSPWLMPYQGNMVAGLDPHQTGAMAGLSNQLTHTGATNDGFHADSSPWLDQYQGGAQSLKDIQDADAHRRIASSMAAGGNALSGARMGADQTYQNTSDANFNRDIAGLRTQDWWNQQGLNTSLSNARMSNDTSRAGQEMQGWQSLFGMGQQGQNTAQAGLTAPYQDWLRQIQGYKEASQYPSHLGLQTMQQSHSPAGQYGPSQASGYLALLSQLFGGGQNGGGAVGNNGSLLSTGNSSGLLNQLYNAVSSLFGPGGGSQYNESDLMDPNGGYGYYGFGDPSKYFGGNDQGYGQYGPQEQYGPTQPNFDDPNFDWYSYFGQGGG